MIIEITEWIGTYNLKISIMFQYTFFCFKEKILFPGLQINAYQMYHQGLSASPFVQTLVTHLIYINHLSRKGKYEKCIERKSLMQNMICLLYCQVLYSSQRKWINVFNKILVFQCKGGKPSNEKKSKKFWLCSPKCYKTALKKSKKISHFSKSVELPKNSLMENVHEFL